MARPTTGSPACGGAFGQNAPSRPHPSSMLTATDLSCVKGDRELFAGIGFALAGGSWLHVTGGNGAGKTSLLRLLCGLAPPAAGQVSWDGTPVRELGDAYREELLYIGHQAPLKEDLTAIENLQAWSGIKGWAL